jgi:hypothetical protein
VLDGRVARKPYGATLIASLPPDCPRTELIEDVAAFWTSAPQPAPAGATAPSLVMNPWLLCAAAYVAGSIPVRDAARARQGDRPAPGRQRQHRRDQRRARDGQGLGDRGAGGRRRQGFVPVWLGRRFGLPAWRSRSPAAPRSSGTCSRCSCAAAAAKASRRRWASRWRCRRSPRAIGFGAYVVVFAATRLSSLGSLLGVWTFAAAVRAAANARPCALVVLALGGAALVTLAATARTLRASSAAKRSARSGGPSP